MVARAFVLLVVAACAPMPKHPIAVGVLFDGERESLPSRAVPGLELQTIELPVPAPPVDHVTSVLASARSAFGAGQSDQCRKTLRTLGVDQLLAVGNRAAAARALTLEAGCAFLANARDEARAIAERFAAFGLELPSQAVGFEVEQMIGDAIEAANKQPRHPLAIRGEAGARLLVDGLPASCLAPCTVQLAPGHHVIALEADGYEPTSRTVRVPDEKEVVIDPQRASAERAAFQWRARVGRGLPPTDPTGIALLGLATRQPRLAYLQAGKQLAGLLIVDGAQRATGTRERGGGTMLVRELAYDGGLLQRPRIWQRPWFWIAVAGATLAVSGAIIYVTYEPEVRTVLGVFR